MNTKYKIIIVGHLFFCLTNHLLAQSQEVITKWKDACIHIEGVTDTVTIMDRYDSLWFNLPHKNIRSHGTAIFFKHDEKRYLITARHVLFDKTKAFHEFRDELNQIAEETDTTLKQFLLSTTEYDPNRIFSLIFKVPTLDEAIKKYSYDFIMNPGVGPTWMHSYTFSKENEDLAILSLDTRYSEFANQLEENGYKPITLQDISFEPLQTGTEVFTVGFPSATSIIGKVNMLSSESNWKSPYFSLPFISWGKISTFHKQLPFYWVDLSAYPGNSGGPLIDSNNGKLIGIVSAQAKIKADSGSVKIRIPYTKVVKLKVLKNLLDIQISKDKKF